MKGPSAAELAAAIEQENVRAGNYGRRYEARQQASRQPSAHVHQPDREERMQFRDPANPTKLLKGEPGSSERIEQVKKLYPEMASDFQKELTAQNLSRLLALHASNPSQPVEVAREVARAIVEIDDPGIYDDVREYLADDPILEHVDDLVTSSIQAQLDRHEEATRAENEAAQTRRQELLQGELDRLPTDDAEAVLAMVPSEELYELDEDEARLQMRTVAEFSAAQRAALGTFGVQAGLTQELKRYGPHHASDSEQAEYERELERVAVDQFDRKQIGPEEAVDRAAASMIRGEGPSPGLQALQAELQKHTYEGEPEHMSTEAHRRRNPELYIPFGHEGAVDTKTPTRTSASEWEG